MDDYINAIEIDSLCKKYDGFSLDNISFNVPKGSIMGFIGQNGAGKTTTLRLILNIIARDSGDIRLFGMDNIKNEFDIKKRIAVVFDELPFQDIFNAAQIEKVLSGMFEMWDTHTYNGFLDRFQLPKKKNTGAFSKGMKMKLQIAAALSHNADMLIMDEATTGLDPIVRSEMLDIFLEFLQDENHSILMSSHITTDLEKAADSVTFIDKGKLLLSGYKDDILENHGIIKCSRKDYAEIDPADKISARLTDFGAEVMVSHRREMEQKYSGLVMDKSSLDEIMRFYVNSRIGEWN